MNALDLKALHENNRQLLANRTDLSQLSQEEWENLNINDFFLKHSSLFMARLNDFILKNGEWFNADELLSTMYVVAVPKLTKIHQNNLGCAPEERTRIMMGTMRILCTRETTTILLKNSPIKRHVNHFAYDFRNNEEYYDYSKKEDYFDFIFGIAPVESHFLHAAPMKEEAFDDIMMSECDNVDIFYARRDGDLTTMLETIRGSISPSQSYLLRRRLDGETTGDIARDKNVTCQSVCSSFASIRRRLVKLAPAEHKSLVEAVLSA